MDFMMVLNDIIHSWLNLISVSLSVGIPIYLSFLNVAVVIHN